MITEDRWVVNLSKMLLHDAKTEVLKKGLNFAPTPVKIPVQDVIACIEKGLARLQEDEASDLEGRSPTYWPRLLWTRAIIMRR